MPPPEFRLLSPSRLCQRRRPGVSLIEILMAVSVITLAGLPILYMASRNMETTKLDRVRVEAESICHNLLERFGRNQDAVEFVIGAVDPTTGEGERTDLYSDQPEVFVQLGHDRMRELIASNDLRVALSFKRNVRPGLDRLVCAVSWYNPGFRRSEQVGYVRFLIGDHLH